MTGQVNFDSHTDAVVAVAAGLVNLGTPGYARGRPYGVPAGDELRDGLARVLRRGSRRAVAPTPAEVGELTTAAERLRPVFVALADADPDTAATTLNTLLLETGARPELSRHDGEPWHLHFHGRDTSYVAGWVAGCATALAMVVGSEYADRLGVCSAAECDRVYVDVSRNGTRRFCSTACQNRVKAAAFRARRASGV